MIIAGWALFALYTVAVFFLAVRAARKTRTLGDNAVGSLAFSPAGPGELAGALPA